MRPYDEIKEDARAGRAFSNSTEYEAWAYRWCDRCVFEPTCEVLNVALINTLTPAEWVTRDPLSLGNQYECTEFEHD